MNTLSLWKVFRNKIILILGITFVFVISSALLSYFFITPKYEAKASLVVQPQSKNLELMYDDVLANQKLLRTYSEIIKSRKIANEVIQRLDLKITEEQLLEKVKVKAAEESLLTSITVTDHDPERAAVIANQFAVSFSSNLSALMKVDNIFILDTAEKNMTPIIPQPFLYMPMAGMLGFLVGYGLALLLEMTNTSIRSEMHIEKNLGLPILGVISNINKKDFERFSKEKENHQAEDGLTDTEQRNHPQS